MDFAGWADGGILWLSGQVVAHRSELDADFRAIYSTSTSSVRGHELWRLVAQLLKDPASRFHAAVNEWSHPLSREGIVLLQTEDLLLRRWARKDSFKPVTKPWDAAALAARARRLTDERLLRKLRPERFKESDG